MNKSFVSLEVTAYGDTARADALSLEGGLDDALKAIKNRVHSMDSAGQGLQQVLAVNLLALLQTIRLFTERGQAFARLAGQRAGKEAEELTKVLQSGPVQVLMQLSRARNDVNKILDDQGRLLPQLRHGRRALAW